MKYLIIFTLVVSQILGAVAGYLDKMTLKGAVDGWLLACALYAVFSINIALICEVLDDD